MKHREARENLRVFEEGTVSRTYDLAEAMYTAWGKILEATEGDLDYSKLKDIIEESMDDIQYAYECYQEDEEARQESQELVDELEAKEA